MDVYNIYVKSLKISLLGWGVSSLILITILSVFMMIEHGGIRVMEMSVDFGNAGILAKLRRSLTFPFLE